MDDKAYAKALAGEPVPSELAFPKSEYEARHARIRAAMDARGLDALLIADPANIFYVCGNYPYETAMHASVLLPREGEPVIQVASIEVAVAMLKSCIEDIASYGWSSATEICDQLASLIRERGLADKRIGIEMQATGLRIQHFKDLRAALPSVDFGDSTDLLLDLRIVKSAAEVECLRKAAGYTWAGIEAGLAEIAPGKTDNDVAAAGVEAMARAGSEFMSIQPVVTSGHRHGWIHSNFMRVPLKEGDTVFLEFGGVHNRYSAPMMRAAYLGSPPAEVLRVNEAVKETTRNIIDAIRPGRGEELPALHGDVLVGDHLDLHRGRERGQVGVGEGDQDVGLAEVDGRR